MAPTRDFEMHTPPFLDIATGADQVLSPRWQHRVGSAHAFARFFLAPVLIRDGLNRYRNHSRSRLRKSIEAAAHFVKRAGSCIKPWAAHDIAIIRQVRACELERSWLSISACYGRANADKTGIHAYNMVNTWGYMRNQHDSNGLNVRVIGKLTRDVL